MPTRRSARKCALTSPPPYRVHCCRYRRRPQHPRSILLPLRLWRPRGRADDTRTTEKFTSRVAKVRPHIFANGFTFATRPLVRARIRDTVRNCRSDVDHGEQTRLSWNVSSDRSSDMMRSTDNDWFDVLRKFLVRNDYIDRGNVPRLHHEVCRESR